MNRNRSAADRGIKITAPLAALLAVFLVSTALLALPRSSWAFVTRGSELGLVVTAADQPVDVGNLNPGDTKASYLVAKNTGSGSFTYYFDIQKVGSLKGFYRDLVGKSLDEALRLTVKRDTEVLFDGLLAEFSELNLGTLVPGASQRLDIAVHLSGPDVGNEFQGASVTVRFAFRAEGEGGGGGGGNNGGGSSSSDSSGSGDGGDFLGDGHREKMVMPPEATTAAPPPPPEIPGVPEVVKVEPEEPWTPPRTGEVPPYYFYSMGALLFLTGIIIIRRQRSGK